GPRRIRERCGAASEASASPARVRAATAAPATGSYDGRARRGKSSSSGGVAAPSSRCDNGRGLPGAAVDARPHEIQSGRHRCSARGVSRWASADDDELAARGRGRAQAVVAVPGLDVEAGVHEQELDLARIVDVAVEVAHVAIDTLASRKPVVQEANLGALLM